MAELYTTPVVEFSTIYENSLYSYVGNGLKVGAVEGYAAEAYNHRKKNKEAAPFLHHLGRAVALSLISRGGKFEAQHFGELVAKTPKHPNDETPPAIANVRLRLEETEHFFDAYSAVWFRITQGHPPPNIFYRAPTYHHPSNPFTAVLGLKMEKTDGSSIPDNYLNVNMLVSRLL